MGGHKNKLSNSDIPRPPTPPPPPPYPGQHTAYSDNKSYVPPTYMYTNMQNNPYGAYAAHCPVRFPAEVNPGVFNIWGISGYTGNVSTETSLNPEQTYCNLAKIQQSMTGHNQFDPFKFSKTEIDANVDGKGVETPGSDSSSDSGDDSDSIPVEQPPTPPFSKPKTYNYATYCPAPPGYGTYNSGTMPPPCPPTPAAPKKKHRKKGNKDKKDTKDDNKCKSCAGVSGHPVKKITKLGGRPLCWACVWGMYMHGAKKVWEESEEVKSDDR